MKDEGMISCLKKIYKESDIPIEHFIELFREYILAKREEKIDKALKLIPRIIVDAKYIIEINNILKDYEYFKNDDPKITNNTDLKNNVERVYIRAEEGDYEDALETAKKIPGILEELKSENRVPDEKNMDIIDDIPLPQENDLEDVDENGINVLNKKSSSKDLEEDEKNRSVETASGGNTKDLEKNNIEKLDEDISDPDEDKHLDDIDMNIVDISSEDLFEKTDSKTISEDGEDEVSEKEETESEADVKEIGEVSSTTSENSDEDGSADVISPNLKNDVSETEEIKKEELEKKGETISASSSSDVRSEQDRAKQDDHAEEIFNSSLDIYQNIDSIIDLDITDFSRLEKKEMMKKTETVLKYLSDGDFKKGSDVIENMRVGQEKGDEKKNEDGTKKNISGSKTRDSILSKVLLIFTPVFTYFFPIALFIMVGANFFTASLISTYIIHPSTVSYLSLTPYIIEDLSLQTGSSFIFTSILIFTTFKTFKFRGDSMMISKQFIRLSMIITSIMVFSMGLFIYISSFSIQKVPSYLIFFLLVILLSTQVDLLQGEYIPKRR